MSNLPAALDKALAQHGLELLSRLYPPHTLVQVGAGHGAGPMQQWRFWPKPPAAVLIDADAKRMQWAQALLEAQPQWHCVDAVIDETDGISVFYEASNPDEDALLDPRMLAALWPNLRRNGQMERPTKRLDTVLAELGLADDARAPGTTWLIIDCLPAPRILRGAPELLRHATVVWARALLQPLPEADDAGLSAVESLLSQLGYRCVQVTGSNHPAVGDALFVRDWPGVLHRRLSTAGAEHAQLQQAISEAAAERDKLKQGLAEVTRQRDQAHLERDQTQQQRDQLKQDLATAGAERDKHAKLAAEREAQVKTITAERDKLQQQMQKLKEETAEQGHRQRLLEEELIKAEAQIDLIKDLLLRDSVL